MNKLTKKWHSTLKSLKNDKIALLFDKDPDGISAGVIAAKAIERAYKPVDLIFPLESRDNQLSDEFINKLKANNITLFISVDSSLEKYETELRKIAEFAAIFIFDHHKIYNEINHDKITVIKSQYINKNIDGSQYCSAKLLYDLCKEAIDIQDLDWVACIGIIGDSNYITYKDFVDATLKKYKFQNHTEIFNTKFGKAATLISYAFSSLDYDMTNAFNIIYKAKNPNEVLNSDLKAFETIGNQLYQLMEDLPKKAEFYKDMIIYEIKLKYKIGSTLSTIASHKHYPDKSLIVISDIGDDKLHISARRQDKKVPMNNLLENAIKGLENANAGGHAPASGATIMKKDYDKFIEQLKAQV